MAAPKKLNRRNSWFGGGLAERLRTGLQIREDRFDSGTHLQEFSNHQSIFYRANA